MSMNSLHTDCKAATVNTSQLLLLDQVTTQWSTIQEEAEDFLIFTYTYCFLSRVAHKVDSFNRVWYSQYPVSESADFYQAVFIL